MKKTTSILAALMLLFSVSSFATEKNDVIPQVQLAFEKDFATVTDVSWLEKESFYFASFKLNGVYSSAAYNADGELLGTSRVIEAVQLPLSISMAINKKYDDFELPKSVTEITYEGQTYYYITLDNAVKTISLKCYSNGDIQVESKVKK